MSACPTLHILRGAMGDRMDGTPREPQHALDTNGICRFCHRTIR